MRRRLDVELVRRGLAASRAEAAEAVRAGLVTISGRIAEKPSTLIRATEPLAVSAPPRRFVSRGGEKLDPALDRFGVAVAGRRGLDAGASTGGFTDCLLRRGAAHVIALDVGYGQLAWELRSDPRVTVLERTNVRDITPEALPYRAEVVTADLSFISLRLAVPALAAVAVPGADVVVLVKPQFEACRGDVGRGGVVRDPGVWRSAVEAVADSFSEAGIGPLGAMASPLVGPAGNVEFLLHGRLGAAGADLSADLEAAIGQGERMQAAS